MEPKLQIDQRCDRIEKAVESLADSLNVGASVRTILRGEEVQEERGEVTPEELDRAHSLARAHHEAYKRLAPNYGHTPSPVTWEEVTEPRKSLLVGVMAELLDKGVIFDR